MALAPAPGRRVQLQVEQLEDRLVPSRFGREILVNSTTDNNQDGARVAVAPNGDFVIAWSSHGGTDASSLDVLAQLSMRKASRKAANSWSIAPPKMPRM